MTCIVFPGQGSQSQGMVKDFHENFKLAGTIFEEIEDYTKLNIRNIIFNNDNNKLNITQFTQICIFSASYVIFKIILGRFFRYNLVYFIIIFIIITTIN